MSEKEEIIKKLKSINNPFEDKNKHKQSLDCCCNCKNQKQLMCHPMNGNNKTYGWLEDKLKLGKGSITQQLGWVCTMQFEDQSNKDKYYYFDFEHGMCELYERKNE